MPSLLAIDLGVRTGLALFGGDGRLRWYRSQNFGTAARLRRALPGIFQQQPQLRWLILEGGGALATLWEKEANRRQVAVRLVSAEKWREMLLLPREQRTGADAKHCAGEMARRVIEWSGAARPTALRHDAAEAILAGLWGVIAIGWLSAIPDELKR
ncbi:hypothetical protein DESUT3_16860 [Desulfuromonas versatilis]|uniref:Uncharacterized protein n=1 Tax=Desulfuromonas versatilis TaxID=2802975 RepID=A0ABN6DX77_9BACT|nr:hypothetical protein [Desulfuromonas versatilis]BCR04617.1 hypothetical protein DESUT3_16860 [Desulfuromonas versatilis]